MTMGGTAESRGAAAAADVVPPLPELPVKESAAADGSAGSKESSKELERVQKELTEAKETLVNERKRNAELAMNAARARNDQQKINHTNSKLNQTIDELKAKIEELEKKEKEPAAAKDDEGAARANSAGESGHAASAPPAPSHDSAISQNPSLFPAASDTMMPGHNFASENHNVAPSLPHDTMGESNHSSNMTNNHASFNDTDANNNNSATSSGSAALHPPTEADFMTDRLTSQFTPAQEPLAQEPHTLVPDVPVTDAAAGLFPLR